MQTRQDKIEMIADHLITNPVYFAMTDPEEFLNWGCRNLHNFAVTKSERDFDYQEPDIDALFTAWQAQTKGAAA